MVLNNLESFQENETCKILWDFEIWTDHLISPRRLDFPEEHKGRCKGIRKTRKVLYIDQHINNDSQTGIKHLAMAWMDYKKAYVIV